MPWKDVVQVSNLLLERWDADNFPTTYLGLNFLSALQIDSAKDSSATSSGIFDAFRYFNCTDERDKVYALLSFPPLCELRPPIQPDYSKSVAEVFEEATVRIFTHCNSLGLLSSLEHGWVIDKEWPSWVPRWDRSRTTQILHDYDSGRVHSSTPRLQWRPGVLISGGVRTSMLSWCGEFIRDGTTPEMDFLKQPLQELLSKLRPKITHSADPLLLDIAMTLTVGLDKQSKSPPPEFRLNFLAFLVSISPSLDILDATRDLLQELVEQGQAGDAANFYAAASRGSRNKRFFCTQNGEFGVGPRAAQTGDHVVLLYGSNAPCLLRPKGSYYQIVGECYLHHHMHGEVIEMAEKELLPIEDFELR